MAKDQHPEQRPPAKKVVTERRLAANRKLTVEVKKATEGTKYPGGGGK